MANYDFFEDLKEDQDEDMQEWADAASLLVKLKSAQSLPDKIKAYAIPAAIGAGVLGGLAWVENRPRSDTGQSIIESRLERAVESRRDSPEPSGLLPKLRDRTTEFAYGTSRAFRQHPVKSALMAALTGAAGGKTIADRLGIKANWR